MLYGRNSVVNIYRICLTPLSILNSLSSNAVVRMGVLALKASSFGVAFLSLAIATVACATLDSRPAAETVKERAQARWNALVAGDTKTAYTFFTPTTRQTLKYEDYAANVKRGFWTAVTVEGVECGKEGVCTAHATIEYQYKGANMKTPVQETWIREGTNWWYAVKE
jgi:hypothetical protein